MKSERLCFSPTGGGEKIAKAIQRGLDGNDDCNIVPYIFVVPVYGGHMPEIAKKYFGDVSGTENHPAILVAVYGNRAFENALVDLDSFVRSRGFNPIAAGAFVGEHSYSTEKYPIAAGRPDADDLKAAEDFGRLIRSKLLAGNFSSVNSSELHDEPLPEKSIKNFIAFIGEYRIRQSEKPQKLVPEYDVDLCSECGTCVEACPTGAIMDDFSIDASRCISCCACVKLCPNGVRRFDSPFAKPLSENFSLRKSPCWIL